MTLLKRRLNASGYEATLGSIKTPVIVGGADISKDEFVPGVNCSFHPTAEHPRGEAFLDINHIDSLKTARVDSERDGEITHEANGFHHVMKVSEEGKLKWDMIFTTMPPPLRFRIKHSRNLNFYKQQLSAQDILNGNEYAYPEAEGSYAVYFNDGKRDNKYQTGKVCHIDSPFFIDANGKRSPLCGMALIEVEPGVQRLVLDLPTQWLNNAAYPVRLDPIIGYDTKGASNTNYGGNYWQNPVVQVGAVDGQVTKFGIYVTSAVGASIRMAIYECDQTSPYDSEGHSLIGYAEFPSAGAGLRSEGTIDGGAGLISANTYYRIGNGIPYTTFYDSTSTYNWHGAVPAALGWPPAATMTTTNSSTSTLLFSMWVEYDEVSGQDVLMGGGLLSDSVLSGGSFNNFGGFGL